VAARSTIHLQGGDTKATEDTRFSTPLYTIVEASAFLGVPTQTLATWAKGYERRPPGRRVTRSAPIIHAVSADRRQPSIPFVGLAEGLVVAAFRRSGVSMQHIRKAVAILRKEMKLEYALASRKLYVDGARVLFDYAEHADDEQLGGLTVVVSQQRVFAPVVREYLECITYGWDDWPRTLISPISRAMTADPARSFGRPIFVRGAAPVEEVVDRFEAGEALADVAEDFGVPEDDLEDVLRARLRIAA
jgi:uncharacterized protein (DUF433 family)